MLRILPTSMLLIFALISNASGDERPNIIYILADDLGYGDLSCQGQEKFTTPNIDALAATGMRFTQHYSGSTVCAPSRCALLTGKHTGHCVVRGNAEVKPEGQQPMPADTLTLGHLLQTAGYKTGIFGKWGLGAPGSASEPLLMGFDRFYGYNCQRLAHHYYPYFLWNDRQREILWGNFGLEEQAYAPDLIQEQTLKFLEDNQKQPFFCYYAMIQPHAEMFAPEEYMVKYRGKFLPESAYKGTDGGPNYRKGGYGSQPESHAAFAAMVSVMDDDIGELIAKLEELGIADNTLVIFSSDNGPHQEGGHDPDYFNSNGLGRGHKRDLYEGGIHVPMIANWAGKIEAASETAHLSAFWDVLPTIADLVGVAPPHDCDGVSFLPTLLGKEGQTASEYLYWEFHERKGREAIRWGDWKGVRYNVDQDPNSRLELYNLRNDPSENSNIATGYPEVVEKLDRFIQEAHSESPVERFQWQGERRGMQGAEAKRK
ncbi:arylsulfatase [Adhaeretor mobilis]|nr:arylsulfatase [Adhaeretor mobilis]